MQSSNIPVASVAAPPPLDPNEWFVAVHLLNTPDAIAPLVDPNPTSTEQSINVPLASDKFPNPTCAEHFSKYPEAIPVAPDEPNPVPVAMLFL